jgi:hypothetical protein
MIKSETTAFEIAKEIAILYDDIDHFSLTIDERIDAFITTVNYLTDFKNCISLFMRLVNERKEYIGEPVEKQFNRILTAIFNYGFTDETQELIYQANEDGFDFFKWDNPNNAEFTELPF